MKKVLLLCLCSLQIWAQEAIPLKGEEIFGSINARHIGPAIMSGRVTDLEVHPTDPKIIYVGSAGGGVWRSTDAGVTYKPLFDKHIQSIGVVKLDPKQPDQVIWVGTGETWTRNSVSVGDGIYKSTDGGTNWKNMGLKSSERISSIVIHPENTNEVYVGVLGKLWGDSEDRGVYKTTDGGETWEKIFSVNETTGCSELIMHPSKPNIMYAAFWEFRRTAYSFNSGGENSALYKTEDGGKTWNKIHSGLPQGKLGRFAIALAPSNPDILYTVVEAEKDQGLYRSENAGASWTYLNKDFEVVVRPFYFSRLVVDPKNPDIVLKAGLSGYLSKDGGKTFRPINGGVHSDFHDYAFGIKDSNLIYVGTDGGVYRSYDGGNVWEMVRGLPLSQFYHVAVDNQKPYKVYGGLQDNGSWFGPSAKPGGIENRDWIRVGQGDGFRVYPHPTEPHIVYSEMQGAENIWRVDTKRNQIKVIKPAKDPQDPKLRFNWNAPLSTSLHAPDRLYVGSQFVHVSEDRGETWRKISPDLTTNDPAKQNQEESGGISVDNSGAENHCTIFTINESPIDKNILWVGTDDGNVQVSMDFGKNWTNVTPNLDGIPKNTWAYFIEPSPHDAMTAFAVFDGHAQDDRKPYIQKTVDGGKTWKAINTEGVADFVRCIRQDLVNPNLLFLGTEQGLYVSVDGGQNWSAFTNEMPPVAVHYMVIHPRDNALVMATHGRGIIILDDLTPLRSITAELLQKELTFLPIKPVTIRETSGFGGYAEVGEFVGGNPSSIVQIPYFMNKRHTFGKMEMKIYNSEGVEVADISPGKGKGINIVKWAYRLKPPKLAKAKTLAYGAFTGPVVAPGTYKVRITKGKNSYESSFEILSDPESMYTKEEKAIQRETTNSLYAMCEELAFLVEKVDQATSQIEAIKPQIQNARLLKKLNLDQYTKDLEAFKKGLVVTSGDNYVAAAEPELREKISALYGDVADFMGKPSNAQLENYSNLKKELEDAQEKWEGTFAVRLKEVNAALEKAKLNPISLPDWETFMK